jgi:phosphohistidine phosphatase
MTRRTLVILRHAKAEQSATGRDEDRSLTSRGHADASAAGAWLATGGYLPDAVLCSPSRRTRQTWHDVAIALTSVMSGGGGPVVSYHPHLYDGDVDTLIDLLRALSPDARSVLLIGHNPAVSELSARLDPQAEADSDGLRTSGIAVHRLDGEWTHAGSGRMSRTATHTARAD